MRPGGRAMLAATLFLGWSLLVVPRATRSLEGRRVSDAAPPSPAAIEARLALLPTEARERAAVRELQAAMALERVLQAEESTWNRVAGGILTPEEQALALSLADMVSPAPRDRLVAPAADPDMVALARSLLDRYGYVPVDLPGPPASDGWSGLDRRTRARALDALVRGPGIDADRAAVLLVATLDFLDGQVRRGANLELITRLLPVAMGEAPEGP